MTIDEIELYDVEAVDEILSHLSDEDANVVQRVISSLCEMITIREIYYNGGVCYILLKEGKYTVKISHVVPTNPQIAEELLRMNIAKAYEEMARLIRTGRR